MRVFSATLAAALALTTSSALPASYKLNGWYPCDVSASDAEVGNTDESVMPFECGEVDVPLCYDGICDSDRTISIFVKRLPANETFITDGETPKAVWVLQGGPGGSSLNMEGDMIAIQRHLDYSATMYTMDHRGTGRSFFLQCDAAQAFSSGSPWGVELSPTEVPNCIRDILYQIDNQTEAFSVTSAAKDMEFLVTELNAEEEVYVYGASYGTYLTERLMHLAPANVKGYILDGVVPEDDPTFTTTSITGAAPEEALASYCENNEACASMFANMTVEPAGVYETWQAIYDDMDATEEGLNSCIDLFRVPLIDDEKHVVSNAIKTSLSSYAPDTYMRTLIPGILKLIHRCSSVDDFTAVKYLMQQSGGYITTSSKARQLADGDEDDKAPQTVDVLTVMSPLLHFAIKASEMWASPSPMWQEELDNFHKNVFSGLMAADYLYTCLVRGDISEPACSSLTDLSYMYGQDLTEIEPVAFVYSPDEYYQKFATIPDHASVLIINGKLDFNTPSVGGVAQYEGMEGGEGKIMVEMDYGAHCTGIRPTQENDDSQCGYSIIASFVSAGGKVEDVDTGCLELLPEIELLSADDIVSTYVYGESETLVEDSQSQSQEGDSWIIGRRKHKLVRKRPVTPFW